MPPTRPASSASMAPSTTQTAARSALCWSTWMAAHWQTCWQRWAVTLGRHVVVYDVHLCFAVAVDLGADVYFIWGPLEPFTPRTADRSASCWKAGNHEMRLIGRCAGKGGGILRKHGLCECVRGILSAMMRNRNGCCLTCLFAFLSLQVGRIPEDVLSKITSKVLQGLAFLHKKHMVSPATLRLRRTDQQCILMHLHRHMAGYASPPMLPCTSSLLTALLVHLPCRCTETSSQPTS